MGSNEEWPHIGEGKQVTKETSLFKTCKYVTLSEHECSILFGQLMDYSGPEYWSAETDRIVNKINPDNI